MQSDKKSHLDTSKFPHTDLPESLAIGLALPMQNDQIFSTMHAEGHKNSFLFSVGHMAVEKAATAALAEKQQTDALLIGCEIFELLSSVARPDTYTSEPERAAAYEVARRMQEDVYIDEFVARVLRATKNMEHDTPVLTDTVREVAASKLAYSDAALTYAVAGAGLMRQVQIRTDLKIAS